MTPGTNTAEIRSASFWTGSLALCASSTMRTMWASTVSWPTAVARSVSAPFWFMQPPITLSPAALLTGMLSPVSIDFIDRRTAGDHLAVGRHPLAGPNQQHFAGDDGLDIDDHLDTVAQHGRGRRLQFDELADRFAGLALGALFQIAAEQHEGDDARRRLEIEEVRAAVRQQAGQAVEVGRTGAEGDQGVHVGAAVARQLDGLLEERQAGAEDAPAWPARIAAGAGCNGAAWPCPAPSTARSARRRRGSACVPLRAGSFRARRGSVAGQAYPSAAACSRGDRPARTPHRGRAGRRQRRWRRRN